MSVDLEAKLIFGANYTELEGAVEDLDRLLDSELLNYASPYYDAPRDEWVVGVALPNNYGGEAEISHEIREAKAKFEQLTDSAVGRIIVAPHVS